MPNLFSYVALFFLFPIISILIFRRLPVGSAVVVVFLLGFLVLPERVSLDLQGFPALNKRSVTAICILLLAYLAAHFGSQKNRLVPALVPPADGAITSGSGQQSRKGIFFDAFLTIYLAAPLLTVWFNRDPIPIGDYFIRGLGFRDALSGFMSAVLACIPFLIARKFLARGFDLNMILRLLAVFGFLYSWLVLFEIRMSPQLHNWVYGFSHHLFTQQVRQEGFRAVVFTPHGLVVASYLAIAASAAASIYRGTTGSDRTKWLWLTVWLLVVLYLQKSLGGIIIGISLVGSTLFLTLRLRLLLLLVVALAAFTYPVFRSSTFFNSESIIQVATRIDPVRADSLKFRLDNEEMLLEKALKRPWFGWGSWGRNRVFNEAGRDISITDGAWIIELGTGGFFGYLSIFGLWTFPILSLWRLRTISEKHLAPPVAIASLLVACLIDFVPNAGLPSLAWLFAGALAGWIRLHQGSGPRDSATYAHNVMAKSEAPLRYHRSVGPPRNR